MTDNSRIYGVQLFNGGDPSRIPPTQITNLAESSTAPVAHTGDTNETVLATIDLPSLPSLVRFTGLFKFTNNANAKSVRARLNSVAGDVLWSGSYASKLAGLLMGNMFTDADGLRGYVAWAPGSGTGAMIDETIDWSSSQTVVITVELGDGSDTVTLQDWTLEVIPRNPT